MKVFVKDARLRRHSVDVDEGASVAHLKLLLANMSLVPAGFVPNLVYQTRILSDGDCVGGIGYSPDLSISLVCVRAAPACSAADCKPHSSRPSDANPSAAAQRALASPAADAGGAAAHAAAGPLTEPPFSSSAASPCSPLAHPSSAAVPLREGSHVRIERLQVKPEMNGRTGVARGALNAQSGRWTVEVAADEVGPTYVGSFRAANLCVIEVCFGSSPAAAADGTAAQAATGPPTEPLLSSTTASPSTPPAAAVREGSRVRIERLQAYPEMNGRTGVVRGAFDAQSGRWTVEVAADEVGPASLGTFRAANLCVIEVCSSSAPPTPAVNVATEWLDELGCVCPKAVDYASQCPKGHLLVPFAGGGCGTAAQRVMCRICHTCAESEQAKTQWLVCSVAGCCAGYTVCDVCASAVHQAPAAVAAGECFFSQVNRAARAAPVCALADVCCCRASRCSTCGGYTSSLAHRLAA